jgi:phage terminase large subunit GpA-like protein
MTRRVEKLLNRCRLVAKPPTRETIVEWAERERNLTTRVSALEGRFRALPYQKFLLEAITAKRYSEHIWMIAAQLVKTESINCVIGYYVDKYPCGIMIVYPTLEAGNAYSKNKLAPLIQGTKALRRKFKASRSRDSGNTLRLKEFAGGDIVIAGTNSAPSLRSSSRRIVIQDEIDSFAVSTGKEGDPCVLADSRAENYGKAIFIKASTPTIKGRSKIEEKFLDSTQHRFFVPCHKCGHKQWLKWKCVKWPDGKPEDAHYVCER